MLGSYLRIALRNLARDRAYATINVVGLAIGVACCILIVLFVRFEFSFEGVHPKSARIYRVLRENTMAGTSARFSPGTSGAITPAMLADFPEVEAATRTLNWGAWIKVDGKLMHEGFSLADPSFLEIFDYPLRDGSPPAPGVPSTTASCSGRAPLPKPSRPSCRTPSPGTWMAILVACLGLLGPGPFLLGSLLAFIIAAGTVAYQARRAAIVDPADSLRSVSCH